MIDLPLWRKALTGKIHDTSYPHQDAHIIRLGGGFHTSLASLEKTNPKWRKDNWLPVAPPSQPLPSSDAPTATGYHDRYEHSRKICITCSKELTPGEYLNNILHLLTNCTAPAIEQAR
jgi:hypothetical protein